MHLPGCSAADLLEVVRRGEGTRLNGINLILLLGLQAFP